MTTPIPYKRKRKKNPFYGVPYDIFVSTLMYFFCKIRDGKRRKRSNKMRADISSCQKRKVKTQLTSYHKFINWCHVKWRGDILKIIEQMFGLRYLFHTFVFLVKTIPFLFKKKNINMKITISRSGFNLCIIPVNFYQL